MLSKAAANALLKTLEEPPPGLLFVLATTEPEKLPPTILSRCQHFRFRRLTDREIQGKLERLCQAAGVDADPAALALVARAADGGMRDAESLLDRLLVTGAPITAAAAEEALGLPPQERLWAMAQALAADDLATLLEHAADLYRSGYAPRTLAEQLARILRDALHLRLAGDDRLGLDQDSLLRLLQAVDDEHERFARRNDLYALEVALIKGRNALRVPPLGAAAEPWAAAGEASIAAHDIRSGAAPEPRQAPATPRPQQTASDGRAAGEAGEAAAGGRPGVPDGSTGGAPEVAAPEAAATDVAADAPPGRDAQRRAQPPSARPKDGGRAAAAGAPTFSWHAVKAKASTQLKAFLQPAAASLEGDEIRVVYQDTHAFHYRQLLQRRDELEALLADVVGPGLRLSIDGPGGGGAKKA